VSTQTHQSHTQISNKVNI